MYTHTHTYVDCGFEFACSKDRGPREPRGEPPPHSSERKWRLLCPCGHFCTGVLFGSSGSLRENVNLGIRYYSSLLKYVLQTLVSLALLRSAAPRLRPTPARPPGHLQDAEDAEGVREVVNTLTFPLTSMKAFHVFFMDFNVST